MHEYVVKFHSFIWNIITHPCPNFHGDLNANMSANAAIACVAWLPASASPVMTTKLNMFSSKFLRLPMMLHINANPIEWDTDSTLI